jgi:hypothetical protein
MRTRGFEPLTTTLSTPRVYRVAPRPLAPRYARFQRAGVGLLPTGLGVHLPSPSTLEACVPRVKVPVAGFEPAKSGFLFQSVYPFPLHRHNNYQSGEPGNRTLMGVTSVVFKTTALTNSACPPKRVTLIAGKLLKRITYRYLQNNPSGDGRTRTYTSYVTLRCSRPVR